VIKINRDCGDIIDRLTIAELKTKRIGTEENFKEFHAFEKAFVEEIKTQYPQFPWDSIKTLMLSINDSIWQLESGLKSGKEELKNPIYLLDEDNKEVLSKIGLTTILIRNFNNLRVQLKNLINTLTKTGFIDVKKNHLSEKGD